MHDRAADARKRLARPQQEQAKRRTTVPDDGHTRHPDLVSSDFRAPGPGQLLVADFTYVGLVRGGLSISRS